MKYFYTPFYCNSSRLKHYYHGKGWNIIFAPAAIDTDTKIQGYLRMILKPNNLQYKNLEQQPLLLTIQAITPLKAIETIDNLFASHSVVRDDWDLSEHSLSQYIPISYNDFGNSDQYRFKILRTLRKSKHFTLLHLNDNNFNLIKRISYDPRAELATLKIAFSQECLNFIYRTRPSSETIKEPSDRHPYPWITIINLTNAITNVYSAIEELDLQINTSQKDEDIKYSKIGSVWNPKVLVDLKNRLEKKHINPQSLFCWEEHTKKDSLYKHRLNKIYDQRDYIFTDNKQNIINSFKGISIYDAINEASYMRSKLCSHTLYAAKKKKELHELMAVSIGDVINLQRLASVLLLESLRVDVALASQIRDGNL